MEDERCHVTIVGQRRRVDLSVPVHAAIAEYTPMLLQECGQGTADDTYPPAWSLALPGARPFPPESTLAESGVVDGATLYLRDVAADEHDEIEVTDLAEEIVSANRSGLAWDAVARAHTMMVAGVAAVVAAFLVLTTTGPARPTAGFGALLAGACLALVAAHATRRGWSLPAGVRLAAALSAVPLTIAAALALPAFRQSVSSALVAAGAAALLGAAAARFAVPHLLSLVVLAFAGLFLPVTVVLSVVGADRVESAAVIVVVLLGVLAVAPTATGHLVALSGGAAVEGGSPAGAEGGVVHMVAEARRLLIGVTIVCCAVAVPALVLLAAASQVWAVALCGTVSFALLLRAGLLNALGAVLPQLAAGGIGLASGLTVAPASFGAPDWLGPVVLVLLAVASLGLGTARVFGDYDETTERPAWMGSLGLLLSVLSVPLAVGVFGVFGQLQNMGQSL
ncbi:hypothetical protein GCM10010129_77120 [Streptomyces fumigatiscleroticus]|nr:hypothetical protein GCM10010129_77120 [Streptomyces fumigatiscleroticus]